jgi:hypothetical protein
MSGWIKLHRILKDWRWYDDHNATRLLVHLLISVNYEEKKWQGMTIKPGSMVISWETLSIGCGLTIRQCRTAMDKLVSSKQVTRYVTNRFQLVSLVKWEELQSTEVSVTGNKADRCQTDDNQMTATKEYKESKELKKTIPSFLEFLNYALEKSENYKLNISKVDLKMKYDAWIENDWHTNGKKPKKIINWKTTLLNTLKFLHKEKKSEKKELMLADKMKQEHGIN